MNSRLRHAYELLKDSRVAAGVAGALAVAVYLVQAFIAAHTAGITMDEGTYLLKGLLFVRGDYAPFQDYGPWTNKTPLAFIIPGFAQAIFEPGLRTGRYFSIFLAVLMLLAVYLTARRLRGPWAGALILWVLALSPANTVIYAQAISQVIVACLLAWSLYFCLGQGRSLWQTTLAAVIGVLIVMTRQNMLPWMGIVVLYIFWQHGRKAGLWALIAATVVFVAFHVVYFPNILSVWIPWLPKPLSVWFRTLMDMKEASSLPGDDISVGWQTELFVFWEGWRYNFFALSGAALTVILWPRLKEWRSRTDFRAAVMLLFTLVLMAAAHLWVSFEKEFCVYCYTSYLSFFAPVGWLLVLVGFPSWVRRPSAVRQILLGLLVLVVGAGVGYGGYNAVDEWLLNLPIPRVSNMRLQGGFTELWRSLSNKFGLPYETLQQLLPTLAGVGLGLFIVIGVIFWSRAARRRSRKTLVPVNGAAPAFSAAVIVLMLGSVLSPFKLLAGSMPMCGWDVIETHEQVGAYLAGVVTPDDDVFWLNSYSPLPLLYISEANFHVGQFNNWYGKRNGDPEYLLRRGYWSDELAHQWIQQDDVVLISEEYMNGYPGEYTVQFDEIQPSPPVIPCDARSNIHVYRRLP